jgi:hypothetical protein
MWHKIMKCIGIHDFVPHDFVMLFHRFPSRPAIAAAAIAISPSRAGIAWFAEELPARAEHEGQLGRNTAAARMTQFRPAGIALAMPAIAK